MRLQPLSIGSQAGLTCPKCGFEQEDGPECLRCGIIFSKFKLSASAVEEAPATVAETESSPATPGHLSRVFHTLPWISLTFSVGVLLLILRQTPPLSIQTDQQAADRVAEKMAQLQLAVQASQPYAVTLNEAELNQWMRDNLAIASVHQAQQAGIPVPAGSEPSVQEVQSALKDVRMNLMGNQLRAYALFALYGKEISLQLDGRLRPKGAIFGSNPPRGSWAHCPFHCRRSTLSFISCLTHPRIETNSSSHPRLNRSGSSTTPSSSPHGSGRSSASVFQLASKSRLPLLEQAWESCYLPSPAEA